MLESRRPALVLIHGAWAGAWIWDSVLAPLRDAGIEARPIELPGNGLSEECSASLDTYVRRVCEEVETVAGPVMLVGHSGGGIVATAAAEEAFPRVLGVAYVAGMMLPSGLGFRQLVDEMEFESPEARGIAPHLRWSTDRCSSWVPPSVARAFFFQDVPVADADAAARRLGTQPEEGRAVAARWTKDRFGRLPRLYIETALDRSVVLAAQRRMQALVPGARVVTMATGHAPQLVDPEGLAEHLAAFVCQQVH